MRCVHLETTTRLTNYMPVPRSVLDLSLPSTAVVLYGVLLDRGTLSQKNDYTDAVGWVYVVYPILELGHLLGLSDTSVKNNLRILEQAGLIRRIRHSRKEANRYYLRIPEDAVMETGTDSILPEENRKSAPGKERKVPPNNRKKQHNFSNQYQYLQEESL